MGYLHREKANFKEAINLVAYRTGISAEIVEKDYYVTMILRCLAEELPFVVFKGGTSLSKCHRMIKRFSEDIDITIDRTLSQSQRKKVKEEIVNIAEKLGLTITNLENTRSRRDYNCYVMVYKSVLVREEVVIQSAVLLETSYTTLSFPTVILPVSNYIGELMKMEMPDSIKSYRLEPFDMKVQGFERTLVDKVFAICDYYLQDKVKKHSRHIYDIYKLLPYVSLNESFKKLVGEVREVRKASPICPAAWDDVNVSVLLEQILIDEVYKLDYQNVTEKLLEEKVPYEMAITALEEIVRKHIFDPMIE